MRRQIGNHERKTAMGPFAQAPGRPLQGRHALVLKGREDLRAIDCGCRRVRPHARVRATAAHRVMNHLLGRRERQKSIPDERPRHGHMPLAIAFGQPPRIARGIVLAALAQTPQKSLHQLAEQPGFAVFARRRGLQVVLAKQ